MKRYHLFEFEDLPWFPDVLRQSMMDFLRFAISNLRIYDPIIPLLHQIIPAGKNSEILDLGSGGGGGIMGVQQELSRLSGQKVQVKLSDLYPNIPAYELVKSQTNGAIDYITEPVDATNVPESLTGTRTIFSAFHHFKPELAKAILKDAARKRVPIGVFEGANKSYWEIALVLCVFPFLILLITPFIRPFRFSRLIFTYIIPLIPLCTMWDGTVSILRLYSPEHLQKLTSEIAIPGYAWKYGKVKHKTGAKVIYLVGYPVKQDSVNS